jgi:hypothetical protein
MELKRRHIERESFCEVCGDPDESLCHVFFLCTLAKRFWREVKKLAGVEIKALHPCSWATDIFKAEICSALTATWLVCGA